MVQMFIYVFFIYIIYEFDYAEYFLSNIILVLAEFPPRTLNVARLLRFPIN